jgi:hypothetical protein
MLHWQERLEVIENPVFLRAMSKRLIEALCRFLPRAH